MVVGGGGVIWRWRQGGGGVVFWGEGGGVEPPGAAQVGDGDVEGVVGGQPSGQEIRQRKIICLRCNILNYTCNKI